MALPWVYDARVRATLILFLAVLSLLRQAPAQPAEIFFDDFSGPSLDKKHWNVVVTGWTVNNEQQAYIDSADVLTLLPGDEEGATNGALAIRPRYRPGFTTPEGRAFDFVSGRVNTRGKLEFMHGRVSARIRLCEGAGLWPAFWILGTGEWPATGEIDVMEHVGAPDWTSVAAHGPGYSGDTPIVSRARFDPSDPLTNWHVYAVDWTADALVFSIDGREVYRATRPMIERHGAWAFDNPKYLILNLALGGTYPQSVNGVDGPYPGLPTETIELIRQQRVQFLVDWVRVVAL